MYAKLILTATCLSAAVLPYAASADDLFEQPMGQMKVATLLPPPVEVLAATSAPTNRRDETTTTVAVLKEPIQKGETIVADNVTTRNIPSSQAFASTIGSVNELIGQQAIRPLAASAPINRLHVRVAPSVMRNQAVTLVFKRGGIELTGRGQALEDGKLGQSIRVINPTTRTTIVGTIAEGGVVEVN